MKIGFIASAVLAILLFSSFAFGDCEPNWKTGNGSQGLSPVTVAVGYITAQIKWAPDGNMLQKEQLIAGGYFSSVCGIAANCAAAWDGNTWKPMGGGLPSYTKAFAVYNNQLFAGGNYAGVYRWNGSNWERLSGSEGFLVYSMAVYNGHLIVGESVSNTGCHLYSWDGSDWNHMSTMTNGTNVPYVTALMVYNGELIAGGDFNVAGVVDCNRIARWDGSNWQPLSEGVNGTVHALYVYDNNLIVGGSFTSAGGSDANNIAAWNGSEWLPMSSGMNAAVQVCDSYNGSLIAAGNFSKAGDVNVNRIARWDGSAWQPLGSGISGNVVEALTEYNGELIAGGNFSKAGDLTVNGIGRWNGAEWGAFGNGFGLAGSNEALVQGLTVYKGELVAIGSFKSAGGLDVNGIARWNGNNWQQLGSGLGNGFNYSPGYALTVYNGDLIAGGSFTKIGGIDANSVARWNGIVWQPLGDGFRNGTIPARVRSLTVYNGELIAGGDFNLSGNTEVNKVAAWDGSQWRPLGSGFRMGNNPGLNTYAVRALTVYNGQLVAGCDVNNSGSIDINGIARWDGSNWQPLGSGVSGLRFFVDALIPFDGKLIAGGNFSKAGDIDANNIAAWDGDSWQPLGIGLHNWVCALTSYKEQLIAGGQFSKSPPLGIAIWDGNSWQTLGGGASGPYPYVYALTSYKGDLIAGGWFSVMGGLPSVYWAKWGVPDPIEGDINHDCAVDLYDLQLLVERWLNDDCLQSGWCYEADLNYDSAVDFSDFADFAAAWQDR
jgi:hypothetical protein